MQLNKYLAHAGICSRRKAVDLIKSGKVFINNILVTESGYKVKPSDMVKVDGQYIRPEEKVYVLLNKPKGYITTVADERGRKTVLDLIADGAQNMRLYPIGRLDRDTTGLLLLTNDGDFAQQLSHPRNEVVKVYHVTLNNVIDWRSMQEIKEGLALEDGFIKVDSISYIPDNTRNRVRVELHSGKNRIVRRIFEHLGFTVERLDRVQYAGLTIRGIGRGAWRYLTKSEVVELKRYRHVAKKVSH